MNKIIATPSHSYELDSSDDDADYITFTVSLSGRYRRRTPSPVSQLDRTCISFLTDLNRLDYWDKQECDIVSTEVPL